MQKVHKELSKHIVGTHGISRNPVVPMMEQTIFFNNLDLILKTLLGNKGHLLLNQAIPLYVYMYTVLSRFFISNYISPCRKV